MQSGYLDVALSEVVAVKPGKRYQLRARVWLDADRGAPLFARLGAAPRLVDDHHSSAIGWDQPMQVVKRWADLSFRATAPDGAKVATVFIRATCPQEVRRAWLVVDEISTQIE